MKKRGYLSLRKAAERTAIPEEHLRRAILEEELPAIPLDDDRHYFVRLSDVVSLFPEARDEEPPQEPPRAPRPRSAGNNFIWLWVMALQAGLLLALLLLLPGGSSPSRENEIRHSAEEIRQWIHELASDDPERRSQARAELIRLGEAAFLELEIARWTQDVDLRERCLEILNRRNFQPGARPLAKIGIEIPNVEEDAKRRMRYQDLIAGGKIEDIVDEDYSWMTTIIDGILSDQEEVARESLWALHRIIIKRGLGLRSHTELATSATLKGFGDPQVRANEYRFWALWWFTADTRDRVASWEPSRGH